MSRMASVITPPRPQREKTGAWLGDPCAGSARHRVYATRRRTAPGGAAIVEVRVDERDAGQEKGDSTSLQRAGAMSHGLDPTFYEHDEDDDAPFESYMEQLAIRQEAAKYHGDPAVVRELGTDAMAAGNIMNETPPGLPLPPGELRAVAVVPRRNRTLAQMGFGGAALGYSEPFVGLPEKVLRPGAAMAHTALLRRWVDNPEAPRPRPAALDDDAVTRAVFVVFERDSEVRFAAAAGTLTKRQLKPRRPSSASPPLAPMEPFAVAFEHAMIHAARALRRNHEDNYDSLNEEVIGGGEDGLPGR
ncbi:hypothetical protein JL722_10876 [Aureococcus anophagefferens]|nr:hypothetical protein JL722_10876 [Aureococcus anophagefferens]